MKFMLLVCFHIYSLIALSVSQSHRAYNNKGFHYSYVLGIDLII